MADTKLTGLTETSVVALDDVMYQVDVSDTTDDAAGSSRKLTNNRFLGLINHVCDGRLTLESGVAVSTSDQTAKTSIYFTPYNGNKIAVYDGTRWKLYSFTELTLALGTLTSGKNYDIFIYDNAGTLTLEALVWTDDTTRATALTTQDGVLVKTGATTRRYLGTFRTTTTTTTEDSASKRFLWNNHNRHKRHLKRQDTSTTTYTYTTDTWRQANGSTANQVEFVLGVAEDAVEVHLMTRALNSTAAIGREIALGVDSTSAPHADSLINRTGPTATDTFPLTAQISTMPAAGYHFISWLERSTATGTCTWTMTLATTQHQSGMTGSVFT